MRWLVLPGWLGVSLAGCLYVADRNHPPVGSIELPSSVTRCGEAVLHARAEDPDGDPLSYSWTAQVQSAEPGMPGRFDLAGPDGWPGCPIGDTGGVAPASAERSDRVLGTGETLVLRHLPMRGTYRVDLQLRDAFGAEGWSHAELEVVDVAPRLAAALRLDGDPAVSSESVPDELTGKYPAHAHYLAWIESIEDRDDDPSCGKGQNVQTWEAVGHAEQDFETWQPICDPIRYPFGALRFRLRPERAGQAGELRVKLTLSDGRGGVTTSEIGRQVEANRPPCALATEPYNKALVTLPVAQASTLSVTSVSNDVPQLLEFTWSIRDEGAEEFAPLAVQLSDALSEFTLPAWFRSPGQKVELRVAVREVGGPEPACLVGEPRCGCSQLHGEECCRWVTWSLVFR